MKKSKLALLAGVTAASALFLAACGSSSKASNTTTYNYVYSSDPDTLDYLASNRATTSDITTNFIDGLFENDQYGNLKPALAEDWSVSKDGLTYTYQLRKDAKWYDSEGNEYANVTAHDFVTALKYLADKKSDALYLVQNSVAGLDDYVNGKSTDFSKVGVKAVDDYTLEYTLTKPETYWNSKLTTATLMPVNEQFLNSAGKDFGTVKPSGILYNGPYILQSFTSKSSIEMKKNENYYDKDNVKIEDVKLTYFDGSDQDYLSRNFADGALSAAFLYPTSSTYKSIEKKFKDNILYGPQDATTYYMTFNVNRQSYNYTTKKEDSQKNDTKTALQNRNFRQSLYFALDRTSFNAQANGKDGADKITRSMIVPAAFVQIDGKDFNTAVEAQLADKDEWKGISLADAQDSIYNPTKAKETFAKAKEELSAQGVKFPIQVDYLVDQSQTILVQQADSMKHSLEETLGKDNIVFNVHKLSADDVNNATYFAQAPEQKDYDIDITGWSPDFQDPSTYLDLANTTDGYLLINMGLNVEKDADKAIISKLGLNDYDALLKEAAAETSDVNTRYTKYAAAQAWITDNALILPIYSRGASPSLTKIKPYSGGYSLVGSKGNGSFYKYRELQSDAVTIDQYKEANEKWLKEKEKANKEYQDDLENHVK